MLHDGTRAPDANNTRGSSEADPVRKLGRQVQSALNLLATHEVPVLEVQHGSVIADPPSVMQTAGEFLGVKVTTDTMAAVVDAALPASEATALRLNERLDRLAGSRVVRGWRGPDVVPGPVEFLRCDPC